MQTSDAFAPRSTTTVVDVYAPCNTSGSRGENPSPPLREIKGNVAQAWREEGRLGSQRGGQDSSPSIAPPAPQSPLAGGCDPGLPGKVRVPPLLSAQGSTTRCEMKDNYRFGDKWK